MLPIAFQRYLPSRPLNLFFFKGLPGLLGIIGFLGLIGIFGLNGCRRIESEKQVQPKVLPLSSNNKHPLPPGLSDFQDVFANVAEQAIPAVVSIYSERNVASPGMGSPYDDFLDNGPFQYFFGDPHSREGEPRRNPQPHKESGLGSGVIISTSGYILTNNHVIEGADIIKVQLMDETEYAATVVGVDKPTDIAVIKIVLKDKLLSILPLGNSDKLRIGEWVLAVGNPYGLSHTVTTGIISAKGRKNTGINSYENFIQTDAAINPGNSGGALLNLSGELIGINTAIFSRSGGYQGIGFAIPINMAKKITQDLMRDGEVTRGWLGVSLQPTEGHPGGALVGGIVPGSPAEKSGIQVGDIITKVDKTDIKDANDLLNRIADLVPNEWVEIWVNRDNLTLSFKARIIKRDERKVTNFRSESDQPLSMVGLQVGALTPELKERFDLSPSLNSGVLILAVEPESRAMYAKLKAGDVLLEINRIQIQDLTTYRSAMNQAVKGNKILLKILRKKAVFLTSL